MVELEGNFLTPDHYVARGKGEWSTAGVLACPETEPTTKLAHTVYKDRNLENEDIFGLIKNPPEIGAVRIFEQPEL